MDFIGTFFRSKGWRVNISRQTRFGCFSELPRFGGIICKFPGGFFLTIPIPHTKKNNPRGKQQQEECAALVMFCLFQVSVDETDAFVLGVYYSFFDVF